MNFLIIMGTLCILLAVNVETKLSQCFLFHKAENQKHITYHFGYVCTKSTCDWADDSSCKSGTYSKVIQWETDIFEIGFQKQKDRPREIVVKIDLNKDYYIEIKLISDNKKKTLKVILNECSHTKKDCSENKNLMLENINIGKEYAIVAIGFRKDKKINFVAKSMVFNRASTYFSPKNEYELKMKGFYFNTNETMKITVSSKFEKDFQYDGFLMTLPTSVGGYIFNKDGYLIHGKDYGCGFYLNPNEGEGLPYIVKEYYNNSENWKATPVEYTEKWGVPYFDETGMKFKKEQMKIKKEKNPKFDETKMARKGCKYVEPKKEEASATEAAVPMEILLNADSEQKLPPEIVIAEEVLVLKPDVLTDIININEFIERVGGSKSLDEGYLSNVGKGGDDFNVKLINGSNVDISYYKFKNPKKEIKKETTTKKEVTGGAGGAGDASRGEKQVKNISTKYIVILILMTLLV